MKQKFLELFDYNFQTNEKLIYLMEPDWKRLPERAIQLINHILSAHSVWNARILLQVSNHPWDMHPYEELIQINSDNHTQTHTILEKFDLNEIISYQNTSGVEFQNKLEDILFHLVNHGTYHRGQIAMLFRESGIDPMVSDYIVYKRI